jgi:hypothetical protein
MTGLDAALTAALQAADKALDCVDEIPTFGRLRTPLDERPAIIMRAALEAAAPLIAAEAAAAERERIRQIAIRHDVFYLVMIEAKDGVHDVTRPFADLLEEAP